MKGAAGVWSVFRKTLREQSRDLLGLSLTLVFAPMFVLLYALFFPSGSTTYGVLVLNQDVSAPLAGGSMLCGGEDVIHALESMTYANGDPLLEVLRVTDRAGAEARLRDRDAEVLLVIPPDFSRSLLALREGRAPSAAPVTFSGDLTNPYYAVAAVMANSGLEGAILAAAGRGSPVNVVEEPLGSSAARSEFEIYVPGLLVFTVILLIFLASMTIAREVEAGTLRRLQISRMTSFDYLGGVTAALVLVGTASVVLAFLTAQGLGFRSQGLLWLGMLILAVTSLSTIGIGLVIACFSKTVTQAFLIANFPLGLMMFFSGAIYPIPRVPLFTLFGRSIGLYDILPPTHAVIALNKVLTLGAGPSEVVYELAALLILSALYFGVGVWLFRRMHLRAG